nr:hypothetical protein [Tanacetum cinerariifolium]
MTARISYPTPVPMPAWTNSEVVRLLAISSPPASPLSPWSSPPPQISFPPLPPILSPPSPLPSASRREDRPEVTLPPRKRLDIALGPRYETERHLLAGWLNMLFRDRRAHAYIRHLMETEAMMSREAWVRATDASDLVHGEVMSLRTNVLGQMLEIRELQATDHRRQTVILELLRIDHRRSTEISELRTALPGQGLVGDHTQSELPEEAGGSA